MNTIPLNDLAAIRVSGEDAAGFLQAQLSADLGTLADGEAGFSAYCQPRGNVIALLRVIRVDDGYILVVARALCEALVAELRKYVLRARVDIEVIDSAVTGTWKDDAMVYAVSNTARQHPDARSAGADDWRAAEIRRGVVWLGPQTTGRYLPQMLGFERLGAVSFRKGCYPGQEVIARVHYLGKVKQLPMVVTSGSPLDTKPGSEVELLDESGAVGTATVIDSAPEAGGSVVFLVARNPRERAVTALRLDDLEVAVQETV